MCASIRMVNRMDFSKKIMETKYSPIRSIVPNIEGAIARGVKVHQMHIGQPNIETPDSFLEGIKNYKGKIVKYTNSRGIAELLDAFVGFYTQMEIEFTQEDILVTHGGSEALIFTIATICNPGDEVLVPEPYYSNYDSFLKMSDAKAVPIQLSGENEYRLPSQEEIEAKITPRTKAILFSNPNNPLGTVMPLEDMQKIRSIAIKHNLYIIADEVYRQFVYDDCFYQSFLNMSGIDEHVILIDSLSKHYSVCGARIGIVASKNKEFIAQAFKLCQARLCVSAIEQFASCKLIGDMPEYMDTVRGIYKERRDLLCEKLSRIEGVTFVFPRAAFYLFAQLPVDDTEEFAKWLLDEFELNGETLSFAPGSGFYVNGEHGKHKARFSFCASELDEIARSAEILRRGIEAYKRG